MSSNDTLGFSLLINNKKIKNSKTIDNICYNVSNNNKTIFIEYIDKIISSNNSIINNENLFWELLKNSANNININFEKYLNRKID